MKKNDFIKNNPDIKLIKPVEIDGTLYVPLDDSLNMYDSYYESKDGEIKQLTIVNIDTCINLKYGIRSVCNIA